MTQGAPIKTTCPYCGVGCGVLATPDGAGGAAIVGDPEHPANFGRLCSKGSALGETLSLDGRLLHPMMRAQDGFFQRAKWDDALDRIANDFNRIIARHGKDSIAFYLSGQLLTEDYYVANKLMKGFIGSSNVDTNSRLCMASTVAGQRRAFGSDTVPGCYEDLDAAELVVLVGSNAAWCHPVLFQRILRNKQERGARLIVLDPRRTATSEDADLFLGLAPGTDSALFCGLLVHLAKTGCLNNSYIEKFTRGFEETLRAARDIAPTPAATALATGLCEEEVRTFFDLFAATPRVVTAFSQGVNQSAQGTDKVNAIINCHLATGRIGKLGASPFSLTGQPNAMGGREVGGLANQLAAHMGFSDPEIDRVRRFWNASRMADREGHKAVQMFEAIARGEIKALWVIGTNPAVSLPAADEARTALAKLDLLIVSDNVLSNDTINSGAQVLLPAQAWGEKSGVVTNSERRISRQRAFLPAPGETKPDWAIVADVARRMGFEESFAFNSVADVFREHAALSAFENEGSRDFDIGALARFSDDAYASMTPTLWPSREEDNEGRARLFGEGGFFTPDARARFVAPAPPALKASTSTKYPLRLNTGRIRDQWHTMTRTGISPRLGQHLPEPFVEIHPDDALASGVEDGGYARVSTRHGECVLKAIVTDRQQRGQLFAPIHWSDETASSARVGALVTPHTDPLSGQPEAKATPAAIESQSFALRGFVLARRAFDMPPGIWWARVAIPDGVGYKIATNDDASKWRTRLERHDDRIEYCDEARGVYRAAIFSGGRVELCVFVGHSHASSAFDAAKMLFASHDLTPEQRKLLLTGASGEGLADDGPVVCACFGVGAKTLERAISGGECSDIDKIGAKLNAGTNCGSCIPELKRLLAKTRIDAPSGAQSLAGNPQIAACAR
jgi:assimilatory nitrate reductase catalytic subunit